MLITSQGKIFKSTEDSLIKADVHIISVLHVSCSQTLYRENFHPFGYHMMLYSRGVKLVARETILKLLMNFGSIATDHRPHLRGTYFCYSEINLLMVER